MERIWKDLKLPSGLAHLTMDALFDIDFVALPHKKYEHDKFITAVDSLRKRFVRVCPCYSFNSSLHDV